MYEFKFKQKRNMLRVGEPVFKTNISDVEAIK